MLFNSSQLKFNVILIVLLGIYNRVDIIMAHQCYVCGPDENVSCDKFDPTNKSFIKECPSAKACSIRTHVGNIVERSCEDIRVQDCQTANNVNYCYCSENLCNGKTINFIDDEDLAEGSGITVITNTVQNEHKTISNTTSQSNHIKFYLYSTYISILTLLCN